MTSIAGLGQIGRARVDPAAWLSRLRLQCSLVGVLSRFPNVAGLTLHSRVLGEGPPVLLLHGWPMSSFLWRNVMPGIAAAGRTAIALDLPGFGQSDKPLDVDYGFAFYERVLDGFVATLDAPEIGLVLHDLGGPVGLHWATLHPERVERLAILNTLVYRKTTWSVEAFLCTVDLPLLRWLWSSPLALRVMLHVGIHDWRRLTPEFLEATLAPFRDRNSRRAMARPWAALDHTGFARLAADLRRLDCPTLLVYGERDRVIPDVGRTMARLARELPHAELRALPECGHFLQEEIAEDLGRWLGEHFRPR